MPLDAGFLLDGRYRIERLHKLGSMGAVYAAYDPATKKKVAVKENLIAGPEAQRAFEAEADHLACLSHPNVPRIFDFLAFVDEGQYYVMQFIEGDASDQWVSRTRPSPSLIIHALEGVFLALQYLHRSPFPVVHRDLEPANVIVQEDFTSFLVDFGSARTLQPTEATQYPPLEALDDQSSLATTLFALLTARTPDVSRHSSHASESVVSARALNPAVPKHVDEALRRALEVNPVNRYLDIYAFWHALTWTPGAPNNSMEPTRPARR